MAIAFDGVTKIITLSSGTTTLSVRDLWSRWVDWWLTSDNSKFAVAFRQSGGDEIDPSAGTSIPAYMYLQNGWRIRPQEANHTLNVTDGVLLVEGGGDPFVSTIGAFTVRINYQQPVSAITVSTSGGSSGPSAADIAAEVRNAIQVELARIDVDVSSRSTQASVDAIATQLDVIEGIATALDTSVDALTSAVASIAVDATQILAIVDVVRMHSSNRTRVDPIAHTLTVYQDDGVVPLVTFQLRDRTGTPSVDEIAERLPL